MGVVVAAAVPLAKERHVRRSQVVVVAWVWSTGLDVPHPGFSLTPHPSGEGRQVN